MPGKAQAKAAWLAQGRVTPFEGGVALDGAGAVGLAGRGAAALSLKHLQPARPDQHVELVRGTSPS